MTSMVISQLPVMSPFHASKTRHFPEGTQMTRPTGGFILWVSLPGRVNTQELHVRALQQSNR